MLIISILLIDPRLLLLCEHHVAMILLQRLANVKMRGQDLEIPWGVRDALQEPWVWDRQLHLACMGIRKSKAKVG
jgi:hypothetical protein